MTPEGLCLLKTEIRANSDDLDDGDADRIAVLRGLRAAELHGRQTDLVDGTPDECAVGVNEDPDTRDRGRHERRKLLRLLDAHLTGRGCEDESARVSARLHGGPDILGPRQAAYLDARSSHRRLQIIAERGAGGEVEVLQLT